jgi:hypothetical protein
MVRKQLVTWMLASASLLASGLLFAEEPVAKEDITPPAAEGALPADQIPPIMGLGQAPKTAASQSTDTTPATQPAIIPVTVPVRPPITPESTAPNPPDQDLQE